MSTPVLHYFDLGSLGRGEPVRLLLRDLAIEFEDKRYAYGETWPATNQEKGISTLTGKLPVFEIDGLRLTQHIAIMRYLARRAGGYDGASNADQYLVDAVSDIYNDWRSAWVTSLSATTDEYKNKQVPMFYELFTNFYSRNQSGPYLLGTTVSYADFLVFQALDNDTATGKAPESLSKPLQNLKDAFHARPNVGEYLEKRSKA